MMLSEETVQQLQLAILQIVYCSGNSSAKGISFVTYPVMQRPKIHLKCV